MQKLGVIIFFLLIGFSVDLSAQIIPFLLKADAQELINKGDIYGAIEKLEKYNDIRPNDSKSLRQLGELYELTRNYQKAATYYYRSYEVDKDKFLISLFDGARMLQMTGAYETALKDFEIKNRLMLNHVKGMNNGIKNLQHINNQLLIELRSKL